VVPPQSADYEARPAPRIGSRVQIGTRELSAEWGMEMYSTWPPPSANFESWPAPRIGGLICFGLGALFFSFRPCRKKLRKSNRKNVILFPIVFGCIFGCWLHFFPCIWWTCDHTFTDGAGVRMAIWLVSWLLLTGIVLSNNIARRERSRMSGSVDDTLSFDSSQLI